MLDQVNWLIRVVSGPIPPLTDREDLMVGTNRGSNISHSTLMPNRRGLERVIGAGVKIWVCN